jgi:hypothetical protein
MSPLLNIAFGALAFTAPASALAVMSAAAQYTLSFSLVISWSVGSRPSDSRSALLVTSCQCS